MTPRMLRSATLLRNVGRGLVLAALLTTGLRSSASTCVRYDRAIHVQDYFHVGSSFSLASNDSVVCIGTRESLLVLDASNGHPRVTARTPIRAQTLVALSATHALVYGTNGVWIVDVRDREHPVAQGPVPMDLPGASTLRQTVFLRGSLAAVVQPDSVNIVSLETPQSPASLSTLPLPSGVTSSIGDGLICVVCADHVLRVVDWTDPLIPVVVGEIPVQGEVAAMKDGFAYLVRPVSAARIVLEIVDLQDPHNPRAAGSVELAGIPAPVAIAAGRALVRAANTVTLVDVQDPYAPAILGVGFTMGSLHGVSAAGTTAFVKAPAGVFALDASMAPPPSPMLSATFVQHAGVLEAAPGRVSVVSNGVVEFDLADPFHPWRGATCARDRLCGGAGALLGDLVSDGQTTSICWGDWCDNFGGDELARVPDGSVACTSGAVLQFGISIIGRVAQIPLPDSSFGIKVLGTHAFVACSAAGLQVVDVSPSSPPAIVAGLPLQFRAVWVDAAGNYAYVTDEGPGLQVIDITTPTAPRALGRCWLSEGGRLAVDGDTAYIACPRTGVVVVDISEPLSPHVVHNFGTGAHDVGISGELVVSTSENSLDVFSARCSPMTPLAVRDVTGHAVGDAIEIRWAGEGPFELYRSVPGNPGDRVRLDGVEPNTSPYWRCVDRSVEAGFAYTYWVGVVSSAGVFVELQSVVVTAPATNSGIRQVLLEGEPRLFAVECDLVDASDVQVECFDIRGRRLRALEGQRLQPGRQILTWDYRDDHGDPVAAGVYLVRVRAGKDEATLRAVKSF